MAYRPSPVEFPDTLDAVPPSDRNYERAATAINLTMFAVAVLLVSVAYVREDILAGDMRDLWKPGLGVLFAILVVALFASKLVRRACFVRRGDWVAIYNGGRQQRVVSIRDLTWIQLSKIQTVRLCLGCVFTLLIGGVGLPVYLSSANAELVPVAWFLATGLVGVGFAIEIIVGRWASTTVMVNSTEYTLRRAP